MIVECDWLQARASMLLVTGFSRALPCGPETGTGFARALVSESEPLKRQQFRDGNYWGRDLEEDL